MPCSHNIPVSYLSLHSSGGRNLPRSLLGSTVAGDSEGGVFAVPTTLPPNSSRHNRMFSPNKEAELAFRQQLDSISVRQNNIYTNWIQTKLVCSPQEYAQLLFFIYFFADAVRSFPFQTEKTSKQTTSETTRGSGKRRRVLLLNLFCGIALCW